MPRHSALASQSLLQLVRIVEGSQIFLHLMQIPQQPVGAVGLLRAHQPQLGLQPLLPAAPSVEIGGDRSFDRPFPPAQGLPEHAANGLADAGGINASGKQQLKRVGLAAHASDCPDCDVHSRVFRGLRRLIRSSIAVRSASGCLRANRRSSSVHLRVPGTTDETCEPPDGPVVAQQVRTRLPAIREPDRSTKRLRSRSTWWMPSTGSRTGSSEAQ